MLRKHGFKKAVPYFSEKIRQSLERISEPDSLKINEIRLRVNRPVCISSFGNIKFLAANGSLTLYPDMAVKASHDDIEHSFKAVCDYSLHSYGREISEGFVTLEGGSRVGICGSAVVSSGKLETVKYINGLNFRIAGQVDGCSEFICQKLFNNSPVSLLIAGSPASGKTTILKDICRVLGEKYRISIIDERGEIAAVYKGEPQNDIGYLCDVFDGYPKSYGIETAVRVMSPQIVVCDEIGSRLDAEAIKYSMNSGVKIIASVHASSYDELIRREHISELINSSIFDYAVLLGSSSEPGRILSIKKLTGIML